MKRLLYLVIVVFSFEASAQSFPVKNSNDDYVITNLKGSEKFKNDIIEVLRDNSGLYWFRNLTSISSFDGVNWKDYSFKTASGKNITARINEIEVTEDGTFWLGTSEGMFIIDPKSQNFIPMKQKYPGIAGMPSPVNCIYKKHNNFLFISILKEGFYILDWKLGGLKYIIIDSSSKTYVPNFGQELQVTADKSGNYWGLTTDNKGIWYYNTSLGKINRSWKGEIADFPAKTYRDRNISGITYAERDNSLWISYRKDGLLEKVYLSTGKKVYYTFYNDLEVRADSNSRKRHSIMNVKIDGDNNEWTFVAGKYLVKLNDDIKKFEYLVNDPDLLPLGKLNWFLFETATSPKNTRQNDKLIWLAGSKELSVLNKRNLLVRQVSADTLSNAEIKPSDYENSESHNNIFFKEDGNNSYYLFQQDPQRPKLISLDNNFHITKALFNDEWKKYPAYFSSEFNSDSCYIAMMRPEIEPLNFRTVIVKDFVVDLKEFKAEEIKLNFQQRVWHYGLTDNDNNYWLFSNGYLYSYNPNKDFLDSIYVCEPAEKGDYTLELVKGYDYPTVLHKQNSTYWICFFPTKELYKINLKTKKIDRIFKTCVDKKDCVIPTAPIDIYDFDSSRIYFQSGFNSFLINAANDSITYYSDLFNNKLREEGQVGSGIYGNWICQVTTTEINMLNTVSGSQRKLLLNEDFKWQLSQFNSRPLVNDRGEMILMGKDRRGFVVFNLDSVAAAEKPGIIRFSFIKLNDRELLLDSLMKRGALTLKYNGYNSIHFRFSDYSLLGQERLIYEYTLYNGGDTIWNKIEGEPELSFTRITPGSYTLLVRVGNGFGGYSPEITVFNILITPPFTQTVWFIGLIIVTIAAILYVVYLYRLKQLKKLQIIRNNIASDLHDDIGSTLNSISIYSEVAKQQAGKEIPALDQIGLNSRKIIESMSDIVWTINPENDPFEKIIIRMRSFAYQLLKAKKMEYTFEVDEKLNSIALPMQVRKNFYLVFKEAITNVVKYSEASRVSIDLFEKNKTIMLRIRDNGKGIPVNAQTLGNGLMNMTRRAKEIGGELNIISANDCGTEIELMLKT